MSKHWNPGKLPVELRPSRIRRDPAPAAKPGADRAYSDPSEWETWVVVVGVALFGLAIATIVIGFSHITSG